MKLSDFDFELPEELIATRPAVPRSSARLLVAEGATITDGIVTDLVDWLRPGDRLVLNDTKVIPARLMGVRIRQGAQGESSAKIEVTLLEPRAEGTWSALIKPLRKLKPGEEVIFNHDLRARLLGIEDGQGHLAFNLVGDDFDAALNAAGAMPLPPYIAAKRPADAHDNEDYQTVFARNKGAVAAPTASFSDDPLRMMRAARFVSELGFTVDAEALAAITSMAERITIVSAERVQGELSRLLLGAHPREGLSVLVDTGLADPARCADQPARDAQVVELTAAAT